MVSSVNPYTHTLSLFHLPHRLSLAHCSAQDAIRQVQGLVVSAIKSASRVLPAEFDANVTCLPVSRPFSRCAQLWLSIRPTCDALLLSKSPPPVLLLLLLFSSHLLPPPHLFSSSFLTPWTTRKWQNSTFEFNLESLRGHQGVALAVVLGSASLLIISQWPSSKKKPQTVLDALESDPDLSAFIAFYKRLSPQGPFDKPDLACPGSDLIILAPINEAFQDARTQIFPLTEPDWRKMLLSHVIHSPLQHSELIELDSIPSCTLALAKVGHCPSLPVSLSLPCNSQYSGFD